MNKKEISTFAKYMICPANINDSKIPLNQLGQEEFDKYKYKHLSNNYKANSKYDNKILLDYIKKAILNTTSQDKKQLLLLSDGKDSLSLAVAYAELGISCDTLTLLRKEDEEMKKYIKEVTSKMGHTAYFIAVDEIIKGFDIDIFKNSFKCMNTLVLDQGYLFFLFGLKLFFENNNLNASEFEVIDGLGNDEYFGYLMSKQQWQSFKLSQLKLWKLLPNSLKAFKWYVRSPSESHGDLSTLACFFNLSNSYDLNKYFSNIPKSTKKEEYLDFRAFSRGSFHDHQCMMGKTDVASRYLGSKCIFPWLDKNLADYCFNILIDEKLDFDNIINKIPLRRLLDEKIGWNQDKRGVDLFHDLDIDIFNKEVLEPLIPKDIINVIKNNIILNDSVKKRAYLELLNFYVFCLSKNLSEKEIRDILK